MTEVLVAHGVTSPSRARELSNDRRGATVLSLDFWSSRNLAAAGVPFRTPVEYLEGADFAGLDRTARAMAETWYAPIADRLRWREIGLGEMAESEFIRLFIDGVRSVEIADRLLTRESPERVRIMPRTDLQDPIGICYATLPAALHTLATQRGIDVSGTGPARADSAIRMPLQATLLREARNALQAATSPMTAEPGSTEPGRGTVLFLDHAGFEGLAPALRHRGYASRLVVPTWRWGPRLAARRREFAGLWDEVRDDETFFTRLTHRGVPVLKILRPWVEWFLRRRTVELVGILEHFGRLASARRPSALVTLEDLTAECRAVARRFRLLGIPVVVVQHGAVSADMAGFHVMPKEGLVQAVWGETSREWHLAHGMPPDSEVVTGNPRFDPLHGYRPPDRALVLGALGLDPTRPTALLATEWFAGTSTALTVDGEERALLDILRRLREVRGLQVLVKLHPTRVRENEPRMAQIIRESGSDAVLVRDRLWDRLAAADVTLIFNSTVGLEALLLDRPLVAIQYYPRTEKIPYVAWRTALGVGRPEELVPVVTRALFDEGVRDSLRAAREAMLDRIVFSRDGRSADRVADLVAKVAGTGVPDASAGVRP